VRDGRQQTVQVRIAALKADDKEAKLADGGASPSSANSSSLNLSDLGLGLAANDQGIFVTNVKVNSPAEDAGIRRGDRLVMVSQSEIKSTEAARKAVEDAKKQKRDAVLLQLERDGQRFFVGVPFSNS